MVTSFHVSQGWPENILLEQITISRQLAARKIHRSWISGKVAFLHKQKDTSLFWGSSSPPSRAAKCRVHNNSTSTSYKQLLRSNNIPQDLFQASHQQSLAEATEVKGERDSPHLEHLHKWYQHKWWSNKTRSINIAKRINMLIRHLHGWYNKANQHLHFVLVSQKVHEKSQRKENAFAEL